MSACAVPCFCSPPLPLSHALWQHTSPTLRLTAHPSHHPAAACGLHSQVQLPPWALSLAPGANQDHASTTFRLSLSSPIHPAVTYDLSPADGRLALLQGGGGAWPDTVASEAVPDGSSSGSSSSSSNAGSSSSSSSNAGSNGAAPCGAVGSVDRVTFQNGPYTCTRVWVASHDGVRVPLTVMHRSDVRLDGSCPALVHVYGAYGQVRELACVCLCMCVRVRVCVFLLVRVG